MVLSDFRRRAAVWARRDDARGGDSRALSRFLRAAPLIVALAAGAGPSMAATYKWVDERGVVHYSDKMPPEAIDKASVELNKQGIPIKKTDKATTAEERRALEREEERRRQVAKQQEELARRDRALVASYTNEAEIDLARKRALQTIDNVVQSSLAFSEQLNKRKQDAQAKKEEAKGKPIAATLERELEGIETELVRQVELVAQKKREAAVISAKYDADKQRWRELVAAKSASTMTDTAVTTTAPPGAAPGKK